MKGRGKGSQDIGCFRAEGEEEWKDADNMAYICDTESLKENRRVRSCSLAPVTLLHAYAPRFPYAVLPFSTLTPPPPSHRRLWIPRRSFVTLFIRLINSPSFPCSLFADFNTGETRDTVCQD